SGRAASGRTRERTGVSAFETTGAKTRPRPAVATVITAVVVPWTSASLTLTGLPSRRFAVTEPATPLAKPPARRATMAGAPSPPVRAVTPTKTTVATAI